MVENKEGLFEQNNIKPDNAGLLLGMFVTIMFSANISGSHFNPCITLSFMFGNVKQGKFDRILGVLYIAAQVCGAFLGIIFGNIFYNYQTIKFVISGDDMIQSFFLETLGAFFLVFMYLSSTEEKTKFTKDKAIQTIILAGSYFGAMLIAGVKLTTLRASPVNPAIAFAITFSNLKSGAFKSIWIFIAGSLLGSVLSLVFFEFVYKTTT